MYLTKTQRTIIEIIYAHSSDQWVAISYKEFAGEIGVCHRTVKNHIDQLHEAGLIEKNERIGRSNLWRISDYLHSQMVQKPIVFQIIGQIIGYIKGLFKSPDPPLPEKERESESKNKREAKIIQHPGYLYEGEVDDDFVFYETKEEEENGDVPFYERDIPF